MNKILVTGSLGLTGSATVKIFKEKGWQVTGIDSNMRAKFFGTREQFLGESIDIDIRDEQAINELFKTKKFDAIVHTAAQPSHDWAKDHVMEDFTINALGTLILLEATRKHCPTASFIHISTDKVYGDNMTRYNLMDLGTRYDNPFPYNENLGLDFAGQRSLFGCSKASADIYVQEYGNYFGMKTVCFRPGCITGKNHQGAEYHGFLAYLAKCIKEEKEYTIFGYEGKQVRDQIHADDVAAAFYEFAMKPRIAQVYNIGGGPERAVSVKEAIEMLEKATGKKAQIKFGNARKGDRTWDVHDMNKFRSHYPNWEPKYSLSDIIKDLI